MNRIAFDTSTQSFSMAMYQEEAQAVLAESIYRGKKQHGEMALAWIQAEMERLNLMPDDVSGLIVGIGPGSYTGLRIGVAIAKTWGQFKQIPVSTVSSLSLMLPERQMASEILYVPMMDARRETFYTGGYRYHQGQYQSVISDQHIAFVDYIEQLKAYVAKHTDIKQVVFIGDPVIATYQAQLEEHLALPVHEITGVQDQPVASRCFHPAWNLLIAPVDDIAVLEPFYAHATLAEREWQEKQQVNNEFSKAKNYIDITT